MDDADAKHMLPPSEADKRVCGFLIERTEQTPAGQFFATSPELPGLIVAAPTREQLEAKIPDAIGALLRAYVIRSPVITPEMRRAGAEWIIAGFKAQDQPDPEILAQNVFVVMHEAASPAARAEAKAEQYASTPSASDLSNAAKAWYTHIDPQPTVHGKIQGLAAVRAEAKAEQRAEDIAEIREQSPLWVSKMIADFLEQRK